MRDALRLAKKSVRQLIYLVELHITRKLYKLRLYRQIGSAQSLNIVVGASSTQYDGWISTDIEVLDITSANDWANAHRPNRFLSNRPNHSCRNSVNSRGTIHCLAD